MTTREHENDDTPIVRARLDWSVIGASLGGMYASLTTSGVPADDVRYFVSSVLDKFLDEKFGPRVYHSPIVTHAPAVESH